MILWFVEPRKFNVIFFCASMNGPSISTSIRSRYWSVTQLILFKSPYFPSKFFGELKFSQNLFWSFFSEPILIYNATYGKLISAQHSWITISSPSGKAIRSFCQSLLWQHIFHTCTSIVTRRYFISFFKYSVERSLTFKSTIQTNICNRIIRIF